MLTAAATIHDDDNSNSIVNINSCTFNDDNNDDYFVMYGLRRVMRMVRIRRGGVNI